MTKANYAFICDTNFYRELCYDNNNHLLPMANVRSIFKNQRKKELQKGHSAYANPTVIIELLSHLSSRCDPAYAVCRKAVVGMFEHCKQNDQLKLIADSESTLIKLLFNIDPFSHLETTEIVSSISRDVFLRPDWKTFRKHRKQLKSLKKQVAKSEDFFLDDFKNLVIGGLSPGHKGWNPLANQKQKRKSFLKALKSGGIEKAIAQALVLKAAIQAGKSIDFSDQQTLKLVNYVLANFKPPIELYQEILKRLVTTGINLTKKNRQNFIWDIQIAFSIPLNHLLDSKEPILVTGDKEIRKAANAVGLGSKCISIYDYNQLVQ